MSTPKRKRKRKIKSITLQSVRITPSMNKQIDAFWDTLLGVNPDLSRASAIREAIRRGLQ